MAIHYKFIIISSVSLLVNPPQLRVIINRISHFVIWCKGIYGLLTKKQGQASSSDKNLPTALRPESIFLINLVFPKPHTLIAPETKTTDPTERCIKKMSNLRETEKVNGNSTPSPPESAYNQKNSTMMKTRYKIGLWDVVAIAGSAVLGGTLWGWLIGLVVGRFVIRLLFLALAVVLFILAYALIIGGLFWILIS